MVLLARNLRVIAICYTQQVESLILTAAHQTFDFDLWPWPRPLGKVTNSEVKTPSVNVWPWPLTYDLELQSQGSQDEGQPSCKLKADRPHPCNYPHTPTDCRHTDNRLRPVVVVVALRCTGKAEPLILTAAPEIWPWPVTLTPTLKQCNSDLKHDFWHLTLNFDLRPWPTIPA